MNKNIHNDSNESVICKSDPNYEQQRIPINEHIAKQKTCILEESRCVIYVDNKLTTLWQNKIKDKSNTCISQEFYSLAKNLLCDML